ncbi:MAG TPA: FAD-dependent oxidoreductase, partial [Burkholderiales bacterium]|nr:FAD-dependent oxidoreductase [Burkholderiales bacterium]
MTDDAAKPDFRNGFPIDQIPDGGSVAGRVDAEEAILVRRGGELFAVGAHCTHYQGPLAEGLVVGDTVRCPWHHACFSLRSGEALRAPAIDPIPCWRVERVGNAAFAREKLAEIKVDSTRNASDLPASVVIIGGGAAGFAAADMLRREGYQGPVTILSADDSPPVDRPNLSKDFLEGNAQDDWIPLRPPDYYSERRIDLVLNTRVSAIDLKLKRVQITNGKTYDFGALLIATGADPVRPETPTTGDAAILYLRTFADARAIVAKAESAKSVVVVGAGFIGLEVAASMRIRGLAVHVVAPDKVPLERVVGSDVGQVVRAVHEEHGVVFHLGKTVSRVDGKQVTLNDGAMLIADFVVMGVGVRPSITLAEQAGLALDRGIAVDEYLQTSAPGVYAAGDVARWPDPHSGERVRIEHWVVAERQGQVAAQNMLGHRVRFDAVPFFWSKHYDFVLQYVGHADKWDAAEIDGSLAARNCTVTYKRNGLRLAVVTIDRDLESLRAEAAM